MLLAELLKTFLPEIEAALLHAVDAAGECDLYDLARYQLGWMDQDRHRLSPEDARRHGGKKLRPAITLLGTAACGGDWRQALPVGAAIELIHNFSLVHDDVEDGDRMRRHRLTVWGAWGVPKAVNCGSMMQALVYQAILQPEWEVSAEIRLGITRLLTDAIQEMTEGQHLDLDYQERGCVTVVEYFDMTTRKTGALLEAAARSGARVAGAAETAEEGLARFGRSFGLAFQARDDYLGVWGDPGQSGKAVGADILRKKKSLPVVYALEHDSDGAGRVVRTVMAEEHVSEADCLRVIDALDDCGARQFTERTAQQQTDIALDALAAALSPSDARDALLELAHMAALRHH